MTGERRRRSVRILLVLGVALGIACQRPGGPPPAPDTLVLGPEDIVQIRTERLVAGPRIVGTLEPAHRAVLRAEVPGSVVQVRVARGERVTRGQVLCRIEDQGRRSAVTSAREALHAAEQEAELAHTQEARVRRLVDAGALAARELESARTSSALARVRVEQARAALVASEDQWTSGAVVAPFDGVVAERHVDAGDVASPGTPLVTLLDPSSLRLAGTVPADALDVLRPGQEVTLEVRGLSGRLLGGVLTEVAPTAEPASGQIEVRVALPPGQPPLVAGLFGSGRVLADVREAPAVPAGALLDSPGAPAVLRIHEQQATRVAVELGIFDEERELYEVLSGLAAGDVVVTGPARGIRPGTRVRLPEREGITAAMPPAVSGAATPVAPAATGQR